MKLKSQLYVGFTSAIVLSAIIGISTYMAFKGQVADAQWVDHTYKVIAATEDVKNMMLDMEVGKRGYRGTGEAMLLEPYNNGIRKIDGSLKDLKGLVSDNPVQVERVAQLQHSVELLLQYWKNNDEGNVDRSQFSEITNKEKEQMDNIRQQLIAILTAENILLSQRSKASADSINFFSGESLIGTLLVEIIIIILIYFIVTEFNNRRKAQAALLESFTELEQLNAESNNKNWLLTGMANVNEVLQGLNSTSAIAKKVLAEIIQYADIPAGAIYLYDEEASRLMMNASIALPSDAPGNYALHEGLIGKAAESRKTTIIKNIPADYWMLRSGSGKILPGELACVPLWYNDELKGIIELPSFKSFSETAISFMNSVADNIAVAINSADARERVMKLLEQVQKQKEVLQNQEEELRQSNEELSRQTDILQASEEELRVQEEELRQINTELEEKNKVVEIARGTLAEKAQELEITGKYKSEFLANMSHELRTPLNSVLILARLLSENKKKNLDDKQVEYANIIHKSGSDLLNIINDILDLSKIEAGKIDLNFEDIQVSKIVDDLKSALSIVAEEKGINFVTRIGNDVPEKIVTDKMRLEQIIKNFISNAYKFTAKGGTVTLAFDMVARTVSLNKDIFNPADEVLKIAVSDTGIGIPKEKQQLIFEAFQQADGTTSRKYGGTGLGLSISKELVKKLGGEIKLQSEAGVGSTFYVYLPVSHEVQSIAHEEDNKEQIPSISPGRVSRQTTVADDRDALHRGDNVMLIIEDDQNFANVLQDFARSKGYKTIVALKGDEGLYCARTYHPSAITLDMQLPVIDGWSILKLLKSDEILKNIPVHIISSADEQLLKVRDAMTYLKKPVSLEDLERTFSLIKKNLNDPFKKVLVLSGDYLKDGSLKQLLRDRAFDVTCDYVATEQEAEKKLEEENYNCFIADIGKDVNKGVEVIQAMSGLLHEHNTAVIVCLDKDISSTDEMKLKKISDVIIRESVQSKNRLLDELELFLYKVQEVKKTNGSGKVKTDIVDDRFFKDKKVLLVDDDMRNIFALSTLLEEHGMKVITANDGKEAIEELNGHNDIDIVLMDIMMPEMDGYEATRRMRADIRYKDLPIVALTAKAMQGDREKVLEAGASDYITKPVDSGRLFSIMRVWLAK